MNTLAINVVTILPAHDTKVQHTLATDLRNVTRQSVTRINLSELNHLLDGLLKQEPKDGSRGVHLVSSKLYTDISQTPTWFVTLQPRVKE